MNNSTNLPHADTAPLRRQRGFSLVEIILAIGVAGILALGVFALSAASRTNSQVRKEQDHIQAIARSANTSYGITGNFAGLTSAEAISQHLVPQDMVQANTLQHVWGGSVELAPVSIGGVDDNGMKIIYNAVPAKACARLGAAVSQGVWDLLVDDHSVMDGHTLHVDQLTQRCAHGNPQMVFVFHDQASGLTIAQTGTPPANPPPVNPPPVNPPGNPCVAPPPDTQTHPTSAETGVGNCAAGQYGQITMSRPREQSRTTTYSCPAATGNYTSSTSAWSAPYPVPPGTWTVTGNSCAACPTTNTQTGTQWVPVQEDCPSGIGWRRWTKEQTHTRQQQYAACPAGTRTAPIATYTAWSAWTDTGATTPVAFGGGANLLKCKTNLPCGAACPTHVGWYVDVGHYCAAKMPVCNNL